MQPDDSGTYVCAGSDLLDTDFSHHCRLTVRGEMTALLDLVWCYKILFGVVDMPVADFFEFSFVMHTRGHSFKLFKRRSNTCARSSSSVSV